MGNSQDSNEPVAWSHINGTSDTKWHPPQRTAEPVALDWLHKWANQDDGEPETQWHEGYEAARRVVQIHLTAPPQRKPLSNEELDRLWREPMSADWEHREFARAVEAAHGIKEGT